MSFNDLIKESSKKNELFANPLRNFIASFIATKEKVTWSELKEAIEKWTGQINPNTLSFHLSQLMDAGLITKIEVKGQPRYRIVKDNLPEIERLVGEKVLQAVKESA